MTLGDRVCVLRKGLIQQVASPRELCDQPENLFVAGFIGSPPMNFLPARIEEGGLSTPFGHVALEGARAEAVAGRDLLLVGIRPEAPEQVVTKLKDLSRELDAEALHTQAIVPIDAASRIREGRGAEFWLGSRTVHVFDPETGENLTRDPEAGAELTRMAEEDRAEQVADAQRERQTVGG